MLSGHGFHNTHVFLVPPSALVHYLEPLLACFHGVQIWHVCQLCTCSLLFVLRYQDYQASDIPVVEDSSSGSRVRVMAGSHQGTVGPITMVNPGMLLDVVLQVGPGPPSPHPGGTEGGLTCGHSGSDVQIALHALLLAAVHLQLLVEVLRCTQLTVALNC